MLITARDNRLIKEAVLIGKSAKARREAGLFLAEGQRLCYDAAISNIEIVRSFITSTAMEKWPQETRYISQKAGEDYEISPAVAEKLSDTGNNQGVFALCKIPHIPMDMSKNGLYVLLAGLQDPGNVGTVLRTCEALGVKGALIAGSADIWSPKVLRASMGSLFRIPVSTYDDSLSAISEVKNAGCELWGAALDDSAVMLPNISPAEKRAVMIGNEGKGLTIEEKAAADKLVMIPMAGRAESLNAAAASAILIYEMTKE